MSAAKKICLTVMLVGSCTVAADGPRMVQQEEAPRRRSFRVVQAPLRFIGFAQLQPTAEVNARGLETLREATVETAGNTVVVEPGASLTRDDIVSSGTIINTCRAAALFADATDQLLRLGTNEGFVVTAAKSIDCGTCTEFAVSTCGKRSVKSVDCKADGGFSFSCKDTYPE